MSGRLVLALDSATDRLSVALLRLSPSAGTAGAGDPPVDILAEREEDAGRATSARLLPVVEGVLGDARATLEDLGAVVVGVGPGTFTGVRIAVAAARALALALDVPVLGVSTLSALAADGVARLRGGEPGRRPGPGRTPEPGGRPGASVGDSVDLLVPVVDARRGQVFAGVYRRSEGGKWVRGGPFEAVAPAVLEARVAALVGSGESTAAMLVGHTTAPAFAASQGRASALSASAPPATPPATAPPAGIPPAGNPPVGDPPVGDPPAGDPPVGDPPVATRLSQAPWTAVVALDVRAARLVAGQGPLAESGEASAGERIVPTLLDLVDGSWAATPTAKRVPGSLGTPESVVPLYVRAPDADEHILRMRDPFAP